MFCACQQGMFQFILLTMSTDLDKHKTFLDGISETIVSVLVRYFLVFTCPSSSTKRSLFCRKIYKFRPAHSMA